MRIMGENPYYIKIAVEGGTNFIPINHGLFI
jgi:hypothetical protein